MGQGKVLVEWTNSPTGWVSDLVTLTLKDNSSFAVLLERGMVVRDGGDHYRRCLDKQHTNQIIN